MTDTDKLMYEKAAGQVLTKKSDGYYLGCGCGQKAGDKITPPDNSVDLFLQHNGNLIGPVTGTEYNFQANSNSIDIDAADAQAWRSQGIARDAQTGFKGRLTRVIE